MAVDILPLGGAMAAGKPTLPVNGYILKLFFFFLTVFL